MCGWKGAGEDSQEDVGLPVKTQSTSKSSHPLSLIHVEEKFRFLPTRNFLRFDKFVKALKRSLAKKQGKLL